MDRAVQKDLSCGSDRRRQPEGSIQIPKQSFSRLERLYGSKRHHKKRVRIELSKTSSVAAGSFDRAGAAPALHCSRCFTSDKGRAQDEVVRRVHATAAIFTADMARALHAAARRFGVPRDASPATIRASSHEPSARHRARSFGLLYWTWRKGRGRSQ
jgi:hypothetical protein